MSTKPKGTLDEDTKQWLNPRVRFYLGLSCDEIMAMKAEPAVLRARLEEAEVIIEDARQMAEWYASVCNSYETHPHFDELQPDKNAYFYLRSEGELIRQAAAAWLAGKEGE